MSRRKRALCRCGHEPCSRRKKQATARRQRLQQGTCCPAPRTAVEAPACRSWLRSRRAGAATASSRRRRQELQQSNCSPAPHTAVEAPACRSWRRSRRASAATASSRRRRQKLQQSSCSPAPHTAVKAPANRSWRRSPQASEHGDGLKPTTKTEAAAKQLQPCTAHSGE